VAATTLVNGGAAAAFSVVLSAAGEHPAAELSGDLPDGGAVGAALPDSSRPVPHPGRPRRLWVCVVPIHARVVPGSWTSVFPRQVGTSRLTLEAFTVGTLPAIVVFSTLGY
jgi:glutamate:GABA antiporter